jgi:hypothetical protein
LGEVEGDQVMRRQSSHAGIRSRPEGDRRERQLCRNQKSPQSLGLNVNV